MSHLKGENLHAFLEAYARIQEQLLDDLRPPEPGEACCWTVQKHATKNIDYRFNSYVCPSFERAIYVLRHYTDEEDWKLEYDGFILTKKYFIDGSGEWDYYSDVSVLVSPDLEPIIFLDTKSPLLAQEERDVLVPGFLGMCFILPLPFKRGDILVHRPGIFGLESRFVFDHDATLNPTRGIHVQKEHCYTNMAVCGYKVREEDGFVFFSDHILDLLSLEPFDGELRGFEWKLEPLSRFSRGEIDFKRCLLECEALHAWTLGELKVEHRKKQLKRIRNMCGTWSDELHDAVLPPELLPLFW